MHVCINLIEFSFLTYDNYSWRVVITHLSLALAFFAFTGRVPSVSNQCFILGFVVGCLKFKSQSISEFYPFWACEYQSGPGPLYAGGFIREQGLRFWDLFLYKMHIVGGSSYGLFAMKSVRTWPRIDVIGQLLISCSPSSTIYFAILREFSGLDKICLIDWSMMNTIGTALIASLVTDRYMIRSSFGLGAVNMGSSASKCLFCF
ncbi:hypothetical protein Tco_0616099 [Tanacetum coccineum]